LRNAHGKNNEPKIVFLDDETVKAEQQPALQSLRIKYDAVARGLERLEKSCPQRRFLKNIQQFRSWPAALDLGLHRVEVWRGRERLQRYS
jgi:hypothetical protein